MNRHTPGPWDLEVREGGRAMSADTIGALADGPQTNAKPIDIAMLADALERARLQVRSQRQTKATVETLRIIDAALRAAGRIP